MEVYGSRRAVSNYGGKGRRSRLILMLLLLMSFAGSGFWATRAGAAKDPHSAGPVSVGLLMIGESRLQAVEGFQAGLAEHGNRFGITFSYQIKDAGGDRDKLAALAREIIAARPALAVAAGGVEADALKAASVDSEVPVVFLAASSPVQRGLAASAVMPGGNLTGIDTNDTVLTAKRLWFLTKLLPAAKRVVCFNIPTITPSRESAELAVQTAKRLGLDLTVLNVDDQQQAIAAAAELSPGDFDAIFLLPAAPIDQILAGTLLPLSLAMQVPIMGYNRSTAAAGAFAAYGGSRYANGRQAARMAVKILHGADPADLPLESPAHLELVLNRTVIERLELELPPQVWQMADVVLEPNL